MDIRPARQTERHALVALWERSVRATHTFLSEQDVAFYRPLTAQYLREAPEIWVLVDDEQTLLGFLALGEDSIDALFLEPDQRGRGYGRRLVDHAQRLRPGTLTVDVNEQNASAVGFYEALGFVPTGRSASDGTGREFPLLHLRRSLCRAEAVSRERLSRGGHEAPPRTTPIRRRTG